MQSSRACRCDATLILLPVVNVNPPTTNRAPGMISLRLFEVAFQSHRQETEQYLQDPSNRLSKRNTRADSVVGIEPIVGSIVAQAKESAADLVVIASHGRGGLGRVSSGSRRPVSSTGSNGR
jgi:nucleotide-binding universal stress UspA family protein